MARNSRKKAAKGNRTPKCNAKRNRPTLRARMARIRNELSGLRVADGDLFQSMIEQLDTLAGEIAEATDKVMTAGEAIKKSADTIAVRTKDRTTKTHVNRIVKNSGDLFEACSFQDLTGHRISKISRTVSAVGNTFAGVSKVAGGKSAPRILAKVNRIDGDITLEGPQINGPAISQADIDSFFD